MVRDRIRWIPFSLIVLAALSLAGCADDLGRTRATDRDAYGANSGYDRPYSRRQYGPWDMPSQQRQLGPSTWYGCPQQSPGCYPD